MPTTGFPSQAASTCILSFGHEREFVNPLAGHAAKSLDRARLLSVPSRSQTSSHQKTLQSPRALLTMRFVSIVTKRNLPGTLPMSPLAEAIYPILAKRVGLKNPLI